MTAIRSGSATPRLDQEVAAGQHVVERVAAAVDVVGVHERPAEPRRAADVRGEDGDAGGDHRLVLRVEGRPLLRLRPAVQAEHRRAGSGLAGHAVEPAGQRQAVAAEEVLQGGHDQRPVGQRRARR